MTGAEAVSYYVFWAALAASLLASVVYIREARATEAAAADGPRHGQALQVTPATGAAAAAAVLLVFSLFSRTVAAGHPPFANMWGYLLGLSASTIVAYLFLERRTGEKALGAVVLPSAAALLVVAVVFFSPRVEPLIPALNNNTLLAVHVASMIAAYATLTVAFGCSLLHLLQGQRNRLRGLPSSESADRLAHSAILVGFPILGAGIALGAYWADIAWGRYWGWDPKETTALLTWLIYAGYLHARILNGWNSRRTAVLSIVGFVSILFNLFVVNFVIAGLHSYAG